MLSWKSSVPNRKVVFTCLHYSCARVIRSSLSHHHKVKLSDNSGWHPHCDMYHVHTNSDDSSSQQPSLKQSCIELVTILTAVLLDIHFLLSEMCLFLHMSPSKHALFDFPAIAMFSAKLLESTETLRSRRKSRNAGNAPKLVRK